MNDASVHPSFDRFGPAIPGSPVILSVPHAGRDYPARLLEALRVPPGALLPLEDRHVDAVAHAARKDEIMLVASRPRAWIDLNRGEHERDPAVESGGSLMSLPMASTKVKSGLGLVPRRVGAAGDLWARRFTSAEIDRRIAADHRPYHAALADALRAAHVRFGVAVLLDIHSMPTLGSERPQLVLGDRMAQSAGPEIVAAIERAAARSGLRVGRNVPYAGGHVLDRHGNPARDVHAVQLEFDRLLYLDPLTMVPSPDLSRTAMQLRAIIDAAADAALPVPLAAE
ncbi:N-formylglutamate amidohydrolase [Sphingomonas sp.]|uniref:N-formylglutamate amidohydrolase n=1 Tax=Sphingomonas sp. TaxID=28214 RepID=UPI002CC047F0|nr:N-formylglutamate amidohydrolase [Sphingomonas sp.]HTG37198.1 N-formylglutamate amidohydrolase [Sphingomonas sp.]